MTAISGAPLFPAEQWQQVRFMLDELLALDHDSRESRLKDLAQGNFELSVRLRQLLADADKPPELQTQPMLNPTPADEPAIPERVGPFRLRDRIGVGGMGTVYLGERENTDFVQRVAIKLLDVGNANFTRWAARERRILSSLAHPNITAFVDAGVDQQRAWIAMEYVDGETLLEHCRNFGVRERVRLFDQVCAAVAHAHAQLVVHRDLKPSNILVNRQGSAKLLDFGIALALESTDEAAPATRIFTPEYAAPEQLRGERATTATDVHALGLILFELVTQRRLPILQRETQTEEWTGRELARMATANPATVEKSGTQMLEANAKVVHGLLHGDLGRIIAHALNPDPARRYASVALLREDVSRWLDHRPLTIVRPGIFYVTRRLLRRHRIAAGLAGVALLSIVGLAVAALWQAQAKSLEASRAQTALHQSELTREFVSSMFMSADPYRGKGLQVTGAELLQAARQRIDAELSGEPEIAVALLSQIAEIYVSLIDNASTRDVLNKVLEYNARSPRPSASLEASIESRLAYIDSLEYKNPADRQKLDDAVARLRSLGAEARPALAHALDMQSNLLFGENQQERALAVISESEHIYQSLGESFVHEYMLAIQSKADLLAAMERNEEAVAVTESALANAYLQKPEASALRQNLQGVRARALAGLRRYAEAEPAMAEVVSSLSKTLDFENAQVRYWRYLRAQMLGWMGKLDEAHSEIQSLIAAKPSSDVHPVAAIAERVEALNIDDQRRADTFAVTLEAARTTACGEQGVPQFCIKVRLVEAASMLHAYKDAQAQALLESMQADVDASGNAALKQRLLLLRAELARHQGQFETVRSCIEEIRAATGVSAEMLANTDVEEGELALALGDAITAVELLKRGRAFLAQPLARLTPKVKEIDATIARAEARL